MRRLLRTAVDLAAPDPARHVLACRVATKLVALAAFAAFVSLGVQVRGLVGARGLLPAATWLARVEDTIGVERLWRAPTLFWLGASDAALVLCCTVGAAASVALAFGAAPPLCLAAIWLLYLSLTTVGQAFLSFQWDALLLETALLFVFIVPWRLRARATDDPTAPRAALFLVVLLLFRLLFSSGAGKLASGDPAWRDLTALTFHYETQPLPMWTSWFVHQLPPWFHVVCCIGVFVVQIGCASMLFCGRRARTIGALALAALQVAIAATGAYGFFNIIALALCAAAVDDDIWARVLPRRLVERAAPAPPAMRGARFAAACALCVLGPLALVPMVRTFTRAPLPAVVEAAHDLAAPLRSVNGYGLFTVMTTERVEIELEGSDDGVVWRPIAFKYKPGDPACAPSLLLFHMPRLDWQMWFAALSDVRRNRWLVQLQRAIVADEPAVRALLDDDGPVPRMVRAVTYRYRFTRPGEAGWWTRARGPDYAPIISR